MGAARRCGWILGLGPVAAFCPDLPGFSVFWILDGDGRIEEHGGVSVLAPVHGLADGLGGWLRLLVSFFAVLLFQFKNISKK